MSEAGGELDGIVRRGLDSRLFAGAVLRVERGGEALYERAWGRALATEAGSEPMGTSTIFDLASLTKLFTTTAVLRLATEGALRLDDGVARLLSRCAPALGIEGGVLDRLTSSLGGVDLASLLDHSSGIHYWFPFYTRGGEAFEAVLADLLEAHPPTGKTVYSDVNLMIAGRIVEGAAGKPLPEAVGELVLRPLGLARSSYRSPLGPCAATEFGNRIERRMVAELGLSFGRWRDEARPIRGECDDGNGYYYFGGAAGHAGLFSDARDLCRLGRLYLEEGRIGGEAWLDPELARDALRDRGEGRGLGFQLGELYPGGGAGHTGFTGTYLHVNAATGLVVAFLASRLHIERPTNIDACRREVSEASLAAFGRY